MLRTVEKVSKNKIFALTAYNIMNKRYLVLDLTREDHPYSPSNSIETCNTFESSVEPFVIAQKKVDSISKYELILFDKNIDSQFSIYSASIKDLQVLSRFNNGVRYRIYFENAELLAHTKLNWKELFQIKHYNAKMAHKVTFLQLRSILEMLNVVD